MLRSQPLGLTAHVDAIAGEPVGAPAHSQTGISCDARTGTGQETTFRNIYLFQYTPSRAHLDCTLTALLLHSFCTHTAKRRGRGLTASAICPYNERTILYLHCRIAEERLRMLSLIHI